MQGGLSLKPAFGVVVSLGMKNTPLLPAAFCRLIKSLHAMEWK
jgi:hypothetical protein